MVLYELAEIVRSKNAGPFTLTIDLFFSTPEDMGNAAVFLASDNALNITGQCLMVDGGMIKL